MRIVPTIVGAIVAMAPGLAQAALNNRTWVSAKGLDQPGCQSPSNPCRTLQYAIQTTVDGGEIDVLDSAGYGPLFISKSINIVGDGVIAGVLAVSGQPGIAINTPGSEITLRGLIIEGAGVGTRGIQMSDAKSLTLINCTIANFTGEGIFYQPGSNAASTLTVSNTTVVNNGGSGLYYDAVIGNTQRLIVDKSLFANNKNGIVVDRGPAKGAVSDTAVHHNFGPGLSVGAGRVIVRSSTFANNATGLSAIATGSDVAQIFVGSSTISGNGTGTTTSGALSSLLSYGNNFIEDNANGNSAPASAPQK